MSNEAESQPNRQALIKNWIHRAGQKMRWQRSASHFLQIRTRVNPWRGYDARPILDCRMRSCF
jgi:hypothetical protein